jgi:hypothetical protein
VIQIRAFTDMKELAVHFHDQPARGPNDNSKIMFSLFFLKRSGVDSCVFLIFTTRICLKTRLNGVKSICFVQSRKF